MNYRTGEGYVIAEYPELKGYLVKKLEELGTPLIRNMWTTLEDNGDYIVDMAFYDLPKVYDWRKVGSTLKALYINSDAGGTGTQGLANCRVLPVSHDKYAEFRFSLSLDSRDGIDIGDKEILIKRIDSFVEQAKNGYCYHFGGSYCR